MDKQKEKKKEEKGKGKGSLWKRLTPDERSLVLKHRLCEVLSSLVFSTCMPHWNSSYLELVKGDTALMARHYGASASVISIFEMFTSPFVASLSDTIGRKWLACVGRLGWIMCALVALPRIQCVHVSVLPYALAFSAG
jgi:MFS family permease